MKGPCVSTGVKGKANGRAFQGVKMSRGEPAGRWAVTGVRAGADAKQGCGVITGAGLPVPPGRVPKDQVALASGCTPRSAAWGPHEGSSQCFWGASASGAAGARPGWPG